MVYIDVGGSFGYVFVFDKVEDGFGFFFGFDVGGLVFLFIVDIEDVVDSFGGFFGEGIDFVGVVGDEGVIVGDNFVVGGEGEGFVGVGGFDYILFGGYWC